VIVTLVRLEQHEGTAVLTFGRPPANAIDLELVTELDAHLARLEASPPRARVVITGDGRAFSGGVEPRRREGRALVGARVGRGDRA
jgi:enoyl-CoA hydratase